MITRRNFLVRSAQWSAAAMLAPHLSASSAEAGVDANSSVWQIGCYTRPWEAYDYRIAFDAIAQAGYKYVGLMGTNTQSHQIINTETTLEEAHTIEQEARNRDLRILSAYAGTFPVRKSVDAGIEGLQRLIDACAAVGSPSLLLGGVNTTNLYKTYFEVVAQCCDYAADKHVALAIKPHGVLNLTGSQLRKAIEVVGKKNLTVWYDAGNVFYYSKEKINPIDDASSVNGLVTGWCIKDFTSTPAMSVLITPGTGLVNFPAVFQQLKQGGFTSGPLMVETLTPGDPAHLLEEARQARTFVEELVADNNHSPENKV